MELLAPVGSKESFVTAIRAGANAVYLGVKGFNARLSSSPINMYDLQVLIDYAHQRDVQVFLALNTLVKHEEISSVVKSLTSIRPLNPDAFIVQDLGVAGIIKKYFSEIPLHASTQMAVHNRMGVEFLAEQGFARAILARELSFAELKLITNKSPVPIEVFCHGALCFCLSGMCLFSSFIGGLSGNRGRCTQPCRRRWKNGHKSGYLFSPKDLELAQHLPKLKQAGIASLKIEGRMRSSEYVYRVVKAYRLLLDASSSDYAEALQEAQSILSGDMARAKTTCLFAGRDETIIQPKQAQCLGNRIGQITAIEDSAISVELMPGFDIAEGDRLRLSNPGRDTTVAFKVKTFSKKGSAYSIPFGKGSDFERNNPVFKTVDVKLDQKDLERDIDHIYADYAHLNPPRKRDTPEICQAHTALISNKWKDSKKSVPLKEDVLWVRFDHIKWLDILCETAKTKRLVFVLKKENLPFVDSLAGKQAYGLGGELPPFIGQRDTALFQRHIDKMISAGIHQWVINNVSQFGFFKNHACELSAGPWLYTWNAYTAAFWADKGLTYMTVSWEDDFLNIRKMCSPGLGGQTVLYLYGHVPLARSRIMTDHMLEDCVIQDQAPITGQSERSLLRPIFESEMALLISDKPFNIFKAREKLRECGVRHFGIDLSYVKPRKDMWQILERFYDRQNNMPDTLKFNFKRGVK